jgi:tRNA 2-thiouridine synthesizing protein A
LPGIEEKSMNQPSGEVGREGSGKGEFRPRIADRELNLRGKICPYTFIESLLALEEMEANQVLRVIGDYPPAACDVPKSLKNEGCEILAVNALGDGGWEIWVRNREADEP